MRRSFIAGAVLSIAAVAASPAAAQYRVVVLGALNAPLSYPNAINARGQVVGTSSVPDTPEAQALVHGYLWENGRMTDLGTLPGGFWSDAQDINDRGQIVGLALDEIFRPHAVIWEQGQIRELPPPSGADSCGASAINNRGDIVGGCGLFGTVVPVLWRNGTAIVLPVPFGLSTSATDINEAGVITLVGYQPATGNQLAFRLERGEPAMLPPAPGYTSSVPYSINSAGDVVGYSYSDGNPGMQEATLWKDGTPVPLGIPPGTSASLALDLNARGDVVGLGAVGPFGVDAPILWTDGITRMLPIPPGYVGADATVITNRGIIGGTAMLPEGPSVSVLWVPDGSGNAAVR